MLGTHLRSSSFWARAAGSLAFRVACYLLMVWLALWAEARPAPTLPDVMLSWVPYVPWVDRYNYLLWVAGYLPVAIALLLRDGERFIRYMVTAGLVALARGACIVLTGLGPINGVDAHAGMSFEDRWRAFAHLVNLFGFFDIDSGARVALTKDLFFSGHTATTALLLFYVWRWPGLRAVMLVAHLLIVASVFFAHLHYAIDVVGAWAITFSIYALRENNPLRSPTAQAL